MSKTIAEATMGGNMDPTTELGPVVIGPSFLDSIDWGTKLATNTVKVYFAAEGITIGGHSSIGWTAYEQQQAMLALQQFSNIADLHFEITTNIGQADLKLVNQQTAGFLGQFHPPGTAGAGLGIFNHSGTGWDFDQPGTGGLEQGGYGFITLIHEFGHAMGLAHPHDRGGSSTIWQGVTQPFLDLGKFNLNQGIYSTMSYNDGWQTDPDGKNTNYLYGWQGTMMAFDVAVLQQKYGANTTFANGNDSYSLFNANRSGTFWSCIWDTGGTDEIRYDGRRNATIDLRDAHLAYGAGSGGYVSYTKGVYGGYTIAHGAVIENAKGGAGNDVITGNDADNHLRGSGGADILTGGNGADSFDYSFLSESGAAVGTWDKIIDFATGDLINLSRIDAMLHGDADDAFQWIGRHKFNGVEGELRWAVIRTGVLLSADSDGDGVADFKLLIAHATTLSQADLIL